MTHVMKPDGGICGSDELEFVDLFNPCVHEIGCFIPLEEIKKTQK